MHENRMLAAKLALKVTRKKGGHRMRLIEGHTITQRPQAKMP